MTDQWFLDLDGVRSGPYQTSEVMGLIADGEVFPHHRISSSLKDSSWQTILDWRLEQARQIQSKRTPQQSTPSTPKNVDSVTPEIQVMPSTASSPVSAAPDEESRPPPIPTFTPEQDDFLKEIESMEREIAATEASGPKRDPMAEMFDILQNTRQKREAKQIQSAQQASEEEKVSQKKSFSVGRLASICILVSLLGLALGQWYQLSSAPPPSTAKDSKVEAKKDANIEPNTEIVDRSNEKITIRAVVDKKPEPTPTKSVVVRSRSAPPPPPAVQPPLPDPMEEPRGEKKSLDKDLDELRDLKKELQELKALKEELKNAPLSDEFNEGDLGPYPDNAGGSFGGTNGGSADPTGGSANPATGPDGIEPPAPGRPKSSPFQEEYQY
ncbi:MAG: hypothetical protein KGP28_10100 [Bdellovibrionales bacterium]|nr:hypothetical protein [Bdellovibrionales bacterium]